jgi:hypothetical protein
MLKVQIHFHFEFKNEFPDRWKKLWHILKPAMEIQGKPASEQLNFANPISSPLLIPALICVATFRHWALEKIRASTKNMMALKSNEPGEIYRKQPLEEIHILQSIQMVRSSNPPRR